MCLLKWLQGQPGPALLSLFPPKTHLDPPSAGTSSDRTVYPGQLQSSQPSTSGRVQSSPGADASYKAGAASSQAGNEALALDLVCYCLQSGTSAWPGQLPSLRQLCKLALQAAYTLEAHGHHVMALESHQVAQICSLRLNTANDPSKSDLQSASAQSHNNAALQEPDAHQQQQLILNEWHDRLITASLLRCLVDTTHPDSSTPLLDPLALHPLSTRDAQHFLSQRWTLHRTKPSGTPIPDRNRWRKLAHQQIKALQDAGFKVDVAAAISSLQAVYDSLLPASVVDSHQEEGAESVATGGLFRSISGMSAISTPRRNSTFSRCCCCSAFGGMLHDLLCVLLGALTYVLWLVDPQMLSDIKVLHRLLPAATYHVIQVTDCHSRDGISCTHLAWLHNWCNADSFHAV